MNEVDGSDIVGRVIEFADKRYASRTWVAFPEAPMDGRLYVRDGTRRRWVPVEDVIKSLLLRIEVLENNR